MSDVKKCLQWAFFTIISIISSLVWSLEREDLRGHDISSMKGSLHLVGRRGSQADLLRETLGLNTEHSLVVKAIHSDASGNTHTRYRQLFQGLPVWGEQVITHEDSKGNIRATGFLIRGLEKSMLSSLPLAGKRITAGNAVAYAMQAMGHEGAGWDISNTHVELVIYIRDDFSPLYAYSVDYYAEPLAGLIPLSPLGISGQTPSRPFLIIDAQTGKILDRWEGLAHAGFGTGPGGNIKTGQYEFGSGYGYLDVQQSGSVCTLENTHVKTVNLDHGVNGTEPYSYDCPRNTFKQINGAFSPLNDAHFFGGVIFAMYTDWLGVPPLSFQMVMRVHYSNNYENAFWDGATMTFGDGASSYYPLVDINITSHEVSHGFTEQYSGLVYRNQSGGINEAYSDIAGEAAEQYFRGSVDWVVASDIAKYSAGLRFFENPPLDGRSIGHAQDYRSGMDVHFSSGIYNRAFFLIATTPGWTVKKAFAVFAHANLDYWQPNETFSGGACGAIESAYDMGYNAAQVDAAFKSVGVDCGYMPLTDLDSDRMDDDWELSFGLDPSAPEDAFSDLDVDGLTNLQEFLSGSYPDAVDSDSDTLSDIHEVNTSFTDPVDADTDKDSMNDGFEVLFGFDPLAPADGSDDPDMDGFTNAEEHDAGTNPVDSSSKPEILIVSFEDGQAPADWTIPEGAHAGWLAGNDFSAHGSFSLHPGSIAQWEEAKIRFTAELADTKLSFRLKTSSQSDAGFFRLYMDSTLIYSLSGEHDWRRVDLSIPPGVHTLEWVYSRNNSIDEGRVWIDDIRFRPVDLDGDGMSNAWEDGNGLDKYDPADAYLDSDGDLLINLQEFFSNTSPHSGDTDGDGLDDYAELNFYGSDPLDSDSDGDGIPDKWEVENNLGLLDPEDALLDGDGDGLQNLQEYLAGSDPANGDTDDDGLPDDEEVFTYHTNPSAADSDNDGLADHAEIFVYASDPLDGDSDNDGMADGWESENGLGLNHPGDALVDGDLDGLSNLQEYIHGTNPGKADSDDDGLQDAEELSLYLTDPLEGDTDSDGVPDGWEVANGLDPLFNDSALDNDEDGLSSLQEYLAGTDPDNADSDGDALSDHQEIFVSLTDPLSADSDGDGMPDGWEIGYGLASWLDDGLLDSDSDGLANLAEYLAGSNPNTIDSDGDGLADGDEVTLHGTSPVDADSDDDGINDHDEIVIHGSNPLDSDSDDDGMQDGWESSHGLDLLLDDSTLDGDADGLTNLQEYSAGSAPNQSDSDGDGFIDGDEVNLYGTSPVDTDSDNDGLSDHDEVVGHGSNPLANDSDGDGMPDGWEVVYGFNLLMIDSAGDLDGDGLSNLQEYQKSTHPGRNDSDADGMPDGWEVKFGTNPKVADGQADMDGDGLANLQEYQRNTHPGRKDSDTDGMADGWEVIHGLNPLDNDAADDWDMDGLANLQEYLAGSSPLLGDTDGDGVSDPEEVIHLGTNPLLVDSDGDGVSDAMDAFPLTFAIAADGDGDGLPDEWNNGCSQNCRNKSGLVLDPSLDDLDNDGLIDSMDGDNGADNLPPLVTSPPDITLVATGSETRVALGQAVAIDTKDGSLNAFASHGNLFVPGHHLVDWTAQDSAGNVGMAKQVVDIIPLVSFVSETQLVGEGALVTVTVELNGSAPGYPVVIPFVISGSSTSDPEDHNAEAGAFVIDSEASPGRTAIYQFRVSDADGLTGEVEETVVFELVADNGKQQIANAALGVAAKSTVVIAELNRPPVLELKVTQRGLDTLDIRTAGGVVELTAVVNDPNPLDAHTYEWVLDGQVLAGQGTSGRIELDAALLPEGEYPVTLIVTDNGKPAFFCEQSVILHVSSSRSSSGSGGGSVSQSGVWMLLLIALWRMRGRSLGYSR